MGTNKGELAFVQLYRFLPDNVDALLEMLDRDWEAGRKASE